MSTLLYALSAWIALSVILAGLFVSSDWSRLK